MRRFLIAFFVVSLGLLSGCSAGRDIDAGYPRVEYRNSAYNFDPYNREIAVENGYVLDEGNSYERIDTETGYDIVLHFVKDS
nr:MAG TPA: foot protein [Caudoviricetes sp.]